MGGSGVGGGTDDSWMVLPRPIKVTCYATVARWIALWATKANMRNMQISFMIMFSRAAAAGDDVSCAA